MPVLPIRKKRFANTQDDHTVIVIKNDETTVYTGEEAKKIAEFARDQESVESDDV